MFAMPTASREAEPQAAATQQAPMPTRSPQITAQLMAQALRMQDEGKPPQHDLQVASAIAQQLVGQVQDYKKQNPIMFDQNGYFDFGRAMQPNQGWQTQVIPGVTP